MARPKRKFKPEEDAVVLRVGRSITQREAAKQLGIDRRTLSRRMSELGVIVRRWTPEKEEFLKRNYGKIPRGHIVSATKMTLDQVKNKARELGLTRNREWDITAQELQAILVQRGVDGAARKLGRSIRSVLMKAWRLGVHPDERSDSLSVQLVAETLGVADSTVRDWRQHHGLQFKRDRVSIKELRRFILENPLRVNPVSLGDSWSTVVYLLAGEL